jgi:TonB-dependent receptor-like protein/carboxypeptidase family protein
MRLTPAALVSAVLVVTSAAAFNIAAQQPTPARQNSTTGWLVGSVTNIETGAPVRADVTIDRPRRGVRSDSTGRFAFRDVPAGRVRLRAVSFGYTPAETTVVIRGRDTVTVALGLRMVPQSLAPVNTIAKSPERTRFDEQATPSVVSISGAEVRRVPAIGEADVLRSVALLPGVVARNDFSAGFNVRGGEADQNLVLLDGIPIYNPFHLGGLFGTFIDKAVSGVDVLTGAFPSRYGGRLSSVVDVKSLEESRHGVHGTAEVSLLSSSLFGGGALNQGKLSWNIAARRTYADKVIEWIRGSNDFPYHFQDAQFRARLALPSGGSLGLTAYAGKDLLYHQDESTPVLDVPGAPREIDTDDETITFDWGNRVVGLTLDQPLGRRTSFAQRVGFTRFGTHFDLPGQSVYLAQSVTELQLAGSLTHASTHHTLTTGYEAAGYRTSYREQINVGGEQNDVDFPDPLATDGDTTMRQRPATAALFAEDLWKPNARWILRGGLRGEYVAGADWLGVSPRVSVKYFVTPQLAISASGGRYSQWMRAMRNEDLPLRVFDLWLGSDKTIPVSTSTQFVLGAERWFSDTRFMRVEGYHKTYDRLAEPASTVDPRIRPTLLRYYDGRSYGVDVYLRQLERRGFSGWIAYSYGVTTRERNGLSYWPAHDRRHNANVVTAYAPARSRWALGSHLGVATGTPYTGWAGLMNRYRYDPIRNVWGGPGSDDVETVRGPRNGERFPFYWRLDLSAERRFEIGGALVKPYINIVNVFNRKNVFLYTLDTGTVPPVIKGASQFPLLPSIGLRVEW